MRYEVYALNYLQGVTEDDVMSLINKSENGFVKIRFIRTKPLSKNNEKYLQTSYLNISQITHVDVIE